MDGSRYEGALPDTFHLFRSYSPIVSGVLHTLKQPRYRKLDLLHPKPAGQAAVRTAPVALTASGLLATHRWFFSDVESPGEQDRSGIVRTTRFIGITIRGGLGTPSAAPVSASAQVQACLRPPIPT